MKLGYTEFSFGYAFTENLIRSSAMTPTGAPIFPNLIQEAQAGYDVNINLPTCPLFFQYKLPELMVRNSAAEVSQHSLPGLAVPFFRMPLMRRDLSDQHKLLIKLERKFPNLVYYATPEMHDANSFNGAYAHAQVHDRSAMFSPNDIGQLPDDKAHTIAYQSGLTTAWLCSEPREISIKRFEGIAVTVRRLFEDQRYRTTEAAVEAVRREILARVPAELRNAEGAIRERVRSRRVVRPDRPRPDQRTQEIAEELLVSREIAQIGLGVDTLFAQPRP